MEFKTGVAETDITETIGGAHRRCIISFLRVEPESFASSIRGKVDLDFSMSGGKEISLQTDRAIGARLTAAVAKEGDVWFSHYLHPSDSPKPNSSFPLFFKCRRGESFSDAGIRVVKMVFTTLGVVIAKRAPVMYNLGPQEAPGVYPNYFQDFIEVKQETFVYHLGTWMKYGHYLMFKHGLFDREVVESGGLWH